MSEHRARGALVSKTQAMAQEYFDALSALDEAFMERNAAAGERGRDACNAAMSAMTRVIARHAVALELMGACTRAQLENGVIVGLKTNLAVFDKALRQAAN